MEIKWETMDYIAFILLGMLTIFCGNKQLQHDCDYKGLTLYTNKENHRRFL